MTQEVPYYDDEIDLRALAQTLWNGRWLILGLALAAALVAFVLSVWVLPKKYQATAYVFIGQPVFSIAQTTGFTIQPTLPDLNAVVKIAVAPNLLKSVLQDAAVHTAVGNEAITQDMLSSMVAAAAVGKDQLSLQVTDTDPQRAALIANTWADKTAKAVNATYGLGAIAQTLDSQVSTSQHDYDQAQAALEEALSTSQVDALSAQRNSRQADLQSVLNAITRTQSVLDDLQFFEQGLNGLADETPLSLGDGLALTTLRQRSLTVADSNFTVQIDSASFAGFSVSKAREAAAQMRAGLQSQLTRLQDDQSRLEQEIPQLQKDLENAQALLDQFSLKRDLSKDLYSALLQQQQRVATVLGQNAKVAVPSIRAVPSDKRSSPKVMMNTALGGATGGILALFWVFATAWWQEGGQDTK